MNGKDGALMPGLDPATANFLVALAKSWDVSQEEAVRRAVEVPALLDLIEILGNETNLRALESNEEAQRDALVLTRRRQGRTDFEIAEELGEDLRLVRLRWSRALYRLRKLIAESKLKTTADPERLQSFRELQHQLQLTATQAADWENIVRDARR